VRLKDVYCGPKTAEIQKWIRRRVKEMTNPLKPQHGSIFKNLFGILTLLITLALLINMAVIFYVRDNMKKELLDEQELFIDNYATSMDQAFEGIGNLFTYLQSSKELIVRKGPNYFERRDWLKNEMAIQTMLSTYTAISSNVTDIFVYFFDSDYLYTGRGVVDPTVYHDNRFLGDSEQWIDMLERRYDSITFCKYEAEKNNKFIYYPNSRVESNTHKGSRVFLLQSIKSVNNSIIGTICVALDERIIWSIFENDSVMRERQIFIRSTDGKLIAANREGAVLEQLEKIVPFDAITDASQYFEGYGLISHRFAGHMKMEYIVYTLQDDLFRNFEYVFGVAMWISVLSIVLLMVYAYVQSQKMYRPFRNILDSLGGADKACDETDYIARQVLDLLTVNRSMNKTLENSGRMVLQAVLYKMIMGSPALNDAVQMVSLKESGIEDGWFMLIVIRMDLPIEQEELFYVEHHDTFYTHIKECLGVWLVEALETRPDEYTIVLSVRPEDQEQVYSELRGMQKAWGIHIPGASYYIGISGVIEGVHSLRNGYRQAVHALRMRPVQSEEAIFSACMTSDALEIPYIPNDLEQRLRSDLEKGDREHASAYINEVLEHNWGNNITYGAFSSVCMVINQYLFRLLHNKDEQAQSRLIRIKWENDIYSAQRYMEVIFSNLDVAADILGNAQKASVSFIDQAIEYVNAHFNEGINLDSVAQVLGYSPNHLSRNFRMKSGIGFTDYLNGKRVAYAKDLLISTRMNLQDLAEKCGFSSANQLIRVFEKYEGITPNEYRKLERIKQVKE